MNILKLFADSPLHPLQHHMAYAYQSVVLLSSFLELIADATWQQASAIHEKMQRNRIKSQEIKLEILLATPHENHALLWAQSYLIDQAFSIATIIMERKIVTPKEIEQNYQGFI